MSHRFIYISNNHEIMQHCNQMLQETTGQSLQIAKNHLIAQNQIDQSDQDSPVILLYEKKRVTTDADVLLYLKKRNKNLYIILLVTEQLPKEEKRIYLEAGVRDTISSTVNKDVFAKLIFFVENILPKIQKDEAHLQESQFYRPIPVGKRMFDIVVSLSALAVLLPFWILIALIIKVESKGPILYKSKRVGTNYKVFNFFKFRSMYIDAERRLKEFHTLNQYKEDELLTNISEEISLNESLMHDINPESVLIGDDVVIPEKEYIHKLHTQQKNAFVKLEKDPRVTKVGRILRKYSIDELPQLFNVLRGDMSIVGNRPLPLYEAELLTNDESIERFSAPAGITGLWQVEKRGDSGRLSAKERVMLDIDYAQHYSIWMDLKIMLKTLIAFIQKEDV